MLLSWDSRGAVAALDIFKAVVKSFIFVVKSSSSSEKVWGVKISRTLIRDEIIIKRLKSLFIRAGIISRTQLYHGCVV